MGLDKAMLIVVLVSAGCSGPETGAVEVTILDVEPREVSRGGAGAVVSWEARGGGGAVYYSLVVGAAETAVASGRVASGVVQSATVDGSLLEPCANRVVLRVVSAEGAADQDSAELFLCPTDRCGGCTGAVDGDADVDVDADADTDADADSDADDCAGRAFPNGGECDAVTVACCGSTESCEPVMDGSFVEQCQPRAGFAGEGASCGGDGDCRRGLTCVNACTPTCTWRCTNYCLLVNGDGDCQSGGVCSVINTSYGDVRSYGACVF